MLFGLFRKNNKKLKKKESIKNSKNPFKKKSVYRENTDDCVLCDTLNTLSYYNIAEEVFDRGGCRNENNECDLIDNSSRSSIYEDNSISCESSYSDNSSSDCGCSSSDD